VRLSERTEAAELLREVLVWPMRFTPQGRSYHFEGEAALGRLLAGVIGDATDLAPVRGFEKGCCPAIVEFVEIAV
jgi:hypothetical protein